METSKGKGTGVAVLVGALAGAVIVFATMALLGGLFVWLALGIAGQVYGWPPISYGMSVALFLALRAGLVLLGIGVTGK